MSKIEKLTPEQEAIIPVYYEEFLKIGLSTEPCNREKGESALRASYKYLKLPEPEIVWCESPFQGSRLAAIAAKGSEDVTEGEIREQANFASYGSFEAYWGAFYCFITEQLPVKHDGLAQIAKAIMQDCGVYWTFEDLIIVSEKPCEIHLVDNKLHNKQGHALKYRDGTGIFAVNGQRYDSLLELNIQSELKSNET
jgi:hypothetical protein